MSLKVWLPLNKDLRNQGVADVTVVNYGATVNSAGKIGSCYSFNGNSSGRITLNKKCCDFFHDGDSFSYCCWIKITAYASGTNTGSGTGGCVKYQTETSTVNGTTVYGGGFGILIRINGETIAYANPFSSSFGASLGTILLNEWTHVCITFNKATKTLTTYRNGAYVSKNTMSGTTVWGANGVNFSFGYGVQGGWDYTMPNLQNDVRIYDHCLSAKEVSEIAKGLVLHYKLDNPELMLTKYSSITWNQLINQNNFPSSISQNGVTGTVNKSNGSITFNGNCTAYNVIAIGHGSVPVTSGHKYIFKGCPPGGHSADATAAQGGTYDYRVNANGSYLSELGNGLLWTATYTGTMNVYIRVASGYTCNNVVFYPKLFDLTLMFGAGNEPTLEEFLMMFPSNYYSYDPGTTVIPEKILKDVSGYEYNGTITGSLTVSDGSPRYLKNIKFISDSLITSSLQPDVNNSSISFGGWFKFNQAEIATKMSTYTFDANHTYATGNLIGNDSYGGIGLVWTTNNIYSSGVFSLLSVFGNLRTSSINSNNTNAFTVSFDTWTHIFLTYNRDTNILSLYKNGVLINTKTIGVFSDYVLRNFAVNLNWVHAGNGPGMSIPMQSSDVRVYMTALSDSDILDLYKTSGMIDNLANADFMEIIETETSSINIAQKAEYARCRKVFEDGLSRFTQSNCQCTLTDDGYRIYRPANKNPTDHGSTMWGGFVLDNGEDNRFGFQKGHTYMLQFEVRGKTNNPPTNELGWWNYVGWQGGGLIPYPSNVEVANPITTDYNNTTEWKTFTYKWTINDDVYKVCTSAYASYVQGQTYMSYKGFKYGFGYTNTGSLGTDLYIRNIRMYDITNGEPIQVTKAGQLTAVNFVEETIPSAEFTKPGTVVSKQLIEI